MGILHMGRAHTPHGGNIRPIIWAHDCPFDCRGRGYAPVEKVGEGAILFPYWRWFGFIRVVPMVDGHLVKPGVMLLSFKPLFGNVILVFVTVIPPKIIVKFTV